jgi:16S rRNA C967 or C1407 C5-methylase (RsmB/RsmF family)
VPSQVSMIPQLTNDKKLAELVSLQRGLAATGFRLLKKGGCMVYSTCSFSEDQNEGVVKWLIATCASEAVIVPLSFDCGLSNDGCTSSACSDSRGLIQEGGIPGTVRFFPPKVDRKEGNVSSDTLHGSSKESLYGGGFFLAKIKKLS